MPSIKIRNLTSATEPELVSSNFIAAALDENAGLTKSTRKVTFAQVVIGGLKDGVVPIPIESLPVATNNSLGVVQIGGNLSITPQGVLSANPYSLPIASGTVLGGIKVGSNLSITAQGVLSANSYSLPIATKQAVGGVQVGSNLSITPQGLLSVDLATLLPSLPIATRNSLGVVQVGANLSITAGGALTIADDAITTAKIADGVEIKSTLIALYNSFSSTEGGQLLLNEPGVNSPSFSEAQSFSLDTFKDTANVSGHGTNSKMLRIFQGSVSASPTSFADNGNVSFSGSLFPTITANDDLGTASLKWQDVYSSTGAFNGSDLNLKQDIEELSEAEKRVAVTAKGLLKKYRLKKAVEEKGSNARYHFGIIAQELQSAFQAEGLDPMRYGVIAENTWWEKTVDGKRSVSNDAQEGYSEITEMSVRYTELLAFIISAL